MKVTPIPPVAATTPAPRPSQGDPSSPNGGPRETASTAAAPKHEQNLYRAHDHQPTHSADAIIAGQREQTDRLDKLIEKLSRVVRAADGPTAAIGSPTAPASERQTAFDQAVQREIELGKLERTILPNGHVTYRLPMNSVRNLGYEIVGKRTAFIDRGGHIEVSGTGSDHLRAATLHASRKWGNEPVVIYADGKHLDAVIEHAVRAGLNIANEHPAIVAKVAAERKRQADPLGRERTASSARCQTSGRHRADHRSRSLGIVNWSRHCSTNPSRSSFARAAFAFGLRPSRPSLYVGQGRTRSQTLLDRYHE